MDKGKLKIMLDDLGVDSNSYSIDGEYSNESLCLENKHGAWSIYYSERGLRTKEEFFKNEEEACIAFLIRINKMVDL